MSIDASLCVCRDCGQNFIFTPQQQKEFRMRGFGAPTRCPECHERRNARRIHGRTGQGAKYAAVCSVCGKTAQVPFKPSGAKPVCCDQCFRDASKRKARRRPGSSPVDNPAALSETLSQPPTLVEGPPFGGFNLDSRLERAIREAGYEEPTAVQSAAIPLVLGGCDLIGTAQTGTGKTAAFVLPILHALVTRPSTQQCTRALVLTPTRELAEQITQAVRQLGKYTGIRAASVYGGVRMDPQERALRTGAEIIVACPGRLLDHMDRGNTSFAGVDMVVLDEADRMLDMGFLPSIKRILASLPRQRQTMLFSATFAPELDKLAASTLRDPQRVDAGRGPTPGAIAHSLYPCPQHLKTSLLLELLDRTETGSVLVFTRTKHRANRLAEKIGQAGHAAGALHSNKSQPQRQRTMDDFRSGRCQILVATDIAARGLDISTISHVVNYDIPDGPDAYIHRIGRTGRAEREGDAMTLVAPQDHGALWDIEKALGGPIERRKLEGFDYSVPAVKEKPAHRDHFHSKRKSSERPGMRRLIDVP